MTEGGQLISSFIHQQLPGRIVFGAGRRHDVPSEVDVHDPSRVLLIGGSHDVATIDELGAALTASIETIVGVEPHVPSANVRAAIELVDDFEPDVVITIGGGSATGLGKMVALERDVVLFAVPTTYAGSEMTPIWGTTTDGIKTTGSDLRVLPRTVIYDPELTTSLPMSTTVNSVFNAIAHCAESLWLPDTSPIAVEAAVSAIRSLTEGVVELAADPGDLEARSRTLYGAHRAGSVLAVAGTGLLHRSAHILGGMFDLDHGAMYSVLTPLMVRHHLDVAPEARTGLTQALGTDPAGALAELADELGAPRSLAEIGLPVDRLDEAVEAVSLHTETGKDTVRRLLTQAA